MSNSVEEQRIIDAEHLRLLRLGYFVSAGNAAFFGLAGLAYMGMGLFFGVMTKHFPQNAGQPAPPPPEMVGWMLGAIGLAISALCGTVAALKLRVARNLRLRTAHRFCVVVAWFSCLGIPYGTALGVFTLIVLSRPSIQDQFSADRVLRL
jgi:hypothetical protein